jgi:hypothetical protein
VPRAAAALRGQELRDPLSQSRRRLAFPELPTVLLLLMLFSWAHDSDTGRAATFISKITYIINPTAPGPLRKPHVRTSNLPVRKSLRFKTLRSKNSSCPISTCCPVAAIQAIWRAEDLWRCADSAVHACQGYISSQGNPP